MTTLTDADIRSAIERGTMDIEPFSEDHLTPNGYDLAIAEVVLPHEDRTVSSGTAVVPPLTRFLVSTLERVRLGPTMSAQLWLRTSWARRGVIASFGRIDAGFDGTLTFGAFNSSSAPLDVLIGDTFAQLVVEPLTGDAEALYAQRSGHYQDQRGVTMAVPLAEGGRNLVELAAPCLQRGCSACCVETEMPLSREDVARLRDRGHDPDAFTVVEDGFTFLANREGRCFFLDAEGRCTEYLARPEGCRLYPLVLDEDLSDFVMDRLCPHREGLTHDEVHRSALLGLLDRIAKERGPEAPEGVRNL